jgi:DNA-binding transcriptional ArsR family regulator
MKKRAPLVGRLLARGDRRKPAHHGSGALLDFQHGDERVDLTDDHRLHLPSFLELSGSGLALLKSFVSIEMADRSQRKNRAVLRGFDLNTHEFDKPVMGDQMGKAAPKFIRPQLTAAVAHPTRMHAMTILVDREASPKEIAAELNEPINNVTYHVKKLVELGCVELIRTAPVMGGRVVEHFYRATRNTWIDDDEWNALGPAERHIYTTTTVAAMSDDISGAMAAGTFFDPDDNHLSRTPMVVDPEGWDEVTQLLDGTLERLLEIRAKVTERIADQDDKRTFLAKVQMLQFRAPTNPTPAASSTAAAISRSSV